MKKILALLLLSSSCFAGGFTPTGGSSSLPLAGGATNYIQVSNSLQSGSTFYASSGTVNNLNIGTSIKFPDGTVQISSPPATSPTVLASSGVAFGSSLSRVTQDTNTFVYDDRAGVYQLHIGSNPLTGGWTSAGYGPGSFVGWGNSGSGFEYPFIAIETANAKFFPFISFMGDPNSSSTKRFQVLMSTGNSIALGQGDVLGSGGTIYMDAPLNTHIASFSPSGEAVTGGLSVSGSVGIGTTNPAYPLDVTGDINSGGTLRASLASIGSQVTTPKVYTAGSAMVFGTSSNGTQAFSFQNQAGAPFVNMDTVNSSMTVKGAFTSTGTVTLSTLSNTVLAVNASGVVVSTTVPSSGPSLSSTQTWTGSNQWTTPTVSTFTYGLQVGSMTINNITNSLLATNSLGVVVSTPTQVFRSSYSVTSDLTSVTGNTYTMTKSSTCIAMTDATHRIRIFTAAPCEIDANTDTGITTIYRDSSVDLRTLLGSAGTLSGTYTSGGAAISNINMLVYDSPGDTATHCYSVWIRFNTPSGGPAFYYPGTGYAAMELTEVK